MSNSTVPDFLPILSRGSHQNPEAGACVMEMVSFLAGESFSDNPNCVDPALRSLAICINDWVSDDNRNQISLLIPKFMNTRGVENYNTVLTAIKETVFPKYESWTEDGSTKGDMYDLYDMGDLSSYGTPIYWIKTACAMEEGDARHTNQEYDQAMIDYLSDVLDVFAAHLPAEAKPVLDLSVFKDHVSQKANA